MKPLSLLLLLAAGCFSPAGVAAAAAVDSPGPVAELASWLKQPREQRIPLTNAPFARQALSRADADAAQKLLWEDHAREIRSTRAAEMAAKVIAIDKWRMRFDTVSFGDTNKLPDGGRSLFLSMHGGGGAPASVNDSQWKNQIRLGRGYAPAEGIYLAPRAPGDTWDLWHQAHIDRFFDRLIENLVVLGNVNPDRVYILGYSAGGDGVYQLAPRMADRWAAASMMAGHPNEASPLGLRNVPFAIQVGELDAAYRRNAIAKEWGARLDGLRQGDPGGYEHFTELHAGKGHWMEMGDRKAIPWMEKFNRRTFPDRVVWFQDDVTHNRFYWLALPAGTARRGQQITASRDGNRFKVEATGATNVIVRFNDAMVDMDKPVVIQRGERELFAGVVPRTIATLAATLAERGDPKSVFCGEVMVDASAK